MKIGFKKYEKKTRLAAKSNDIEISFLSLSIQNGVPPLAIESSKTKGGMIVKEIRSYLDFLRASFNFFLSSSRVMGLPLFFHFSQTRSGSATRNGFSFSFFSPTPECFDFIFVRKFYMKEAILPVHAIQSYEKTPGFETEADAEVMTQASRQVRYLVYPTTPVLICRNKLVKRDIAHLLQANGTQFAKVIFGFRQVGHRTIMQKSAGIIRLIPSGAIEKLRNTGHEPISIPSLIKQNFYYITM